MTTAGQNVAAGLGLGLVVANLLNSPQRPALRTLITGPAAARTGDDDKSKSLGDLGRKLFPKPIPPGFPFPGMPYIPLLPSSAAADLRTQPAGGLSPWGALLAVGAELGFVAIAVVLAEDYPAPVITFLTILWLIFLARTPHPWRSQTGAARTTQEARYA